MQVRPATRRVPADPAIPRRKLQRRRRKARRTQPAVLGSHQTAQLAAHQRPRAASMLARHQAVPHVPLRRILHQHDPQPTHPTHGVRHSRRRRRPAAHATRARRPRRRQTNRPGPLQRPQRRQTAARLRHPRASWKPNSSHTAPARPVRCRSGCARRSASTRACASTVPRLRLIRCCAYMPRNIKEPRAKVQCHLWGMGRASPRFFLRAALAIRAGHLRAPCDVPAVVSLEDRRVRVAHCCLPESADLSDRRSRSELPVTHALDSAIAAPARVGLR